jgi:hypothetical protein
LLLRRGPVELTDQPNVQAYCHCRACRGWLGASIHAATLWPTPNVKVVKGVDLPTPRFTTLAHFSTRIDQLADAVQPLCNCPLPRPATVTCPHSSTARRDCRSDAAPVTFGCIAMQLVAGSADLKRQMLYLLS